MSTAYSEKSTNSYYEKTACELGFPYCFLTDFTKFYFKEVSEFGKIYRIFLISSASELGVNSTVIAHLTVIAHFNKKYVIIRKCI